MSVQIDYRPHYTSRDYKEWEGDWELIQGLPYAMNSPVIRHQEVMGNILIALMDGLQNCPDCSTVQAVDWHISDDTIVQPDNVVLCGEIDTDFIMRPPSLIVEILSPSTAYIDRHVKSKLYQAEGVRHFGLADFQAEVCEVFELVGDQFKKRADLQKGNWESDLGPCTIEVDVARFWP